MEFSELFHAIGDALSNVANRVSFIIRNYWKALILFVLAIGAVAVITIQSGFIVEIGKFFATEPTGTAVNCEPVTAAMDWKAPTGVTIAPSGKPYCTPPLGADTSFPGCFIVDYNNPEYTNFADLNAIGDPTNLVTRYGTRVQTVSSQGMAKNLCPWTVHYTFLSIGSKKSGGEPRGPDMIQSTEEAFTRSAPGDSQDIESCWNSGVVSTCLTEVKHKITYDINAFTCGRVFAGSSWDHFKNASGASTYGNPGFAVVFNYGRDCSGSSAERAPGSISGGSGSSGSCPAAPDASKVKAAQLTVQCGTTQNVLTWQNPLTLNAAVNSVIRNEIPPGGSDISKFVFTEGGCWNTFGIGTYTDKDVKSGYTYTYTIKTHNTVRSNSVTCKNGSQVASSPIISTATPAVTTTPTITTIGETTPTPVAIEIPVNTFQTPPAISTPLPTSSTSPSGVSTGPDDVVILALMISSIVALAYVTYARSPSGRQAEAEEVSKDQGPLNFKS